jgi:hypothetical protein
LVFFGIKKAAGDLLEIQYQQTKSIPEVREALEAMQDIDSNYRELVEVKGTAGCDNPPSTPYSQKKVAFYVAETYKVSEETREERDNQGHVHTRTVKHEDKLSEEESGEPLLLNDDNGDRIVIETNGVSSKLDLQKTLDRFQNADGYNPNMYRNPHRHFREFNPGFGAGYRLLGYKQVEKTFPLNARLYVLGEAYMEGGQIIVGQPRDKSKPFIVTTKSEEELVNSKEKVVKLNLFGGIGCAVLGVIMIIVQFV